MTPRKVKDLERGGEAQSLSQGIELGLSLAPPECGSCGELGLAAWCLAVSHCPRHL